MPATCAIPFRGVRKKIAETLARSKQTARALHLRRGDRLHRAGRAARASRTRAERARASKLSFLPFIIKATIAALKKFPQLNAMLDEAAQRDRSAEALTTSASPRRRTNGLIVPVIRDADQQVARSSSAREIERLAEATRTGKATRDELTGLDVHHHQSLGTLGGVLATPIINLPEVAILGVHKIKRAARSCATARS